MRRPRRSSRKRRSRWVWVAVACIGFLATGLGGYFLVEYRRQQNTTKLLVEAQEAASAENWNQAVAKYRQYLGRNREDVEAMEAYADALLELAKTIPSAILDARGSLRLLLTVSPSHLSGMEKLTGVYLAIGDFRAARELSQRWVKLAPSSTEATIALAIAQRGDNVDEAEGIREATATVTAALNADRNQPELYTLLVALLSGEARRLDARGRREEAATKIEQASKELRTALDMAPDSYKVHLGAFAFRYYQYDRETKEAARNNSEPEQHTDAAQVHQGEAEKHLTRALELEPDSLETLLPAAEYALLTGTVEETADRLDRAEEVAPNNERVLSLRARWAVKKGSVADFVATADKLWNRARVDTDNPSVILIGQAAELFLRAGELERADQCLAKLEQLQEPGREYVTTERLRAQIETAHAARALGDSQTYPAMIGLQSALRLDPSNTWTLELLARSYWDTGDLPAAADTYDRLADLLPATDRAGARIRLAKAGLAWQRGRIDEARIAAESVLRGDTEQTAQAELIKLACELRSAKEQGLPTAPWETQLQQLEAKASASPLEMPAARWLMRAQVLAGRIDQAKQLLDDLPSQPESSASMGGELGHLMLASGFVDDAQAMADELIREFPDATEGYAIHVKALALEDKDDDALIYINSTDLPPASRARLLETLSDRFLAGGKIEQAVAGFRTAATLDPENLSISRKVARTSDDLDEALAACAKLRAVEGEEGLNWRYEKARALLRLDRSEASARQARPLLDECIAARPQWAVAYFLLGQASELTGEFRRAADAYRNALAQDSDLRTQRTAVTIVRLYTLLGDLDEADRLLSDLLAAWPEQPDVLRLQVAQQTRQSDFEGAVRTAEQILELLPENDAWAATTAGLLINSGKAERAQAVAREVLSRVPDSLPLLRELVRALIVLDRKDEAEAAVRDTLTSDKDGLRHVLYADVLSAMNKFDEAEAALEAAQELAPGNPDVESFSAIYWGLRGDREKQVEHFEKSIMLRGQDLDKSLELARLLFAGNTPEATKRAEQIVDLRLQDDGSDAAARMLKARLQTRVPQPDLNEIERMMHQALASDPRLPNAHLFLAGGVQDRLGRSREALDTIARGLEVTPNNPPLLMLTAQIEAREGGFGRAIQALQSLLTVAPRTPAAQALLATAFQKSGRTGEIITMIERQARGSSLTSTESIIIANAYELTGNTELAETALTTALAQSGASAASIPVFQRYLQFEARRGDFAKIKQLALKRREVVPDDVESISVAALLLTGPQPDQELRDLGFRWFNEIIQNHPQNAANAAFSAGLARYQDKKWDLAEGMFRKASELAPDEPRPVNGLAWMYCVEMGRCDEALVVIKAYLKREGSKPNAELLDTHGTVLLRLGWFLEAKPILQRCLRIAGRTTTLTAATYHLAFVHLEENQPGLAKDLMQKALDLHEELKGLTEDERAHALRVVSSR